jgi:putative transposase
MRKMFQYRIDPTKKQVHRLNDTLEECRWLYNHLLEKPGFPRFKGYGRYDSFTFPQSGFSITHDNRVVLSKIGALKMVYHRPIRGKIKTFATLSTSEEIANPRFFRKEEKALAKVQRKHATLATGTPERRKHRKAVARVHERTRWRRANFTHQQSRHIVDRFGVICVEDLSVNRMTHNHCLAKSIADASWSAFFSQLAAKAEEAGRKFAKVNPAYTSQDCSRCHHRQKMPLRERLYHCPCCLLSIDRDLNAALNIRAVGLHSLGLSLEVPRLSAGE